MIGDRDLDRDDFPFPLDRPITGQDLVQLLPRLLQPLWSQAADAVRATVARVVAVDAGPPKSVTVTAAGRDYDCRYFAAYANPAVNDFVVVVHNASQGIVLGRLA